ncbi:hypothetical protein AURDEDRAFT_112989 [Auricularia subglabra TFB-10046 SS5]|nr:hypothetical protein AURDEDRAFT_112989 [Auricularia subglabra TFB-10046 SS5]
MRASSTLFSACVLAAIQIGSANAFTTRSWADARALARAVVANMTVEEKAGIVSGQGQFGGRCVGNIHGVPRLGVPDICFQDGPAGVRAVDLVSGFPAGINTAATFNRDLMRKRGIALGEEFRGKGAHAYLGPAVDIMRAPGAGRAWEGFGPDEYLTGEAAYETIIGVQSVGVQSVVKHLGAYIQEHYRFWMSSDVDDRTMHELYWQPYLRAVEADVSGIMCSYNKINGTYACAHPELMGPNGLARGEASFEGYFVSDWLATHDPVFETAMSGLDLEMPGGWLVFGGGTYDYIARDSNANATLAARLTEMCENILTPWYRLGQDKDFPPLNFNVQGSGNNQHVNVRTDAHTKLIREIGAASTVLLKNINNALPLGTPASIAIIGEDAAPPQTGCDLNACLGGTLPMGWGSGTITFDYVVAPITALQQRVAQQGNKTVITQSLSNDIGRATSAAQGKSAALVLCAADSGEGGVGLTQVDGNWGDRENLDLWRRCGSLVEAVAKVNNNTILVIHTVGPINVGPWLTSPNVTAVLLAGLPGEQTGPALMDVLYGDYNPSGRLPYTLAKNASDFPAQVLLAAGIFEFAPHIEFTEGLFNDYKHFDAKNIEPAFPFGFGLSYTTFAYSGLSIARSANPTPSSQYTVKFSVKNTGSRAGTEIPQLYLGFPAGAGEPPKLLRGFEAVPLAAGETRSVSISLGQQQLSIWDVRSQKWVRPSGTFTIFVGASSRDVRLQGTF